MITTTKSKLNQIIEAASDTIITVVQSIANNPSVPYSGYTFNPAWEARFEAIKDLNLLTDDGNNFEKNTPENIDRYPYLFFFIDETVDNPEHEGEETFLASLGMFIGVQGTTFAIGAHELNEIHHVCRSILLSDKQLNVIGRGLLTRDSQTGTGSFSGKVCTGIGTAFLADYSPGDWIAIENDITNFAVVDAVASNIELSILEPYKGKPGMNGDICKVSYVKRGAVIDIITWQNTVLAKPEVEGDNVFIEMESYFRIAYKEMVYQCC